MIRIVALVCVIIAAAMMMSASAHGIATCAQMNAAANIMQREVDGFRASAKHAAVQAIALSHTNPRAANARTADAKLFTERANVEQDRVNGIRHNIHHCIDADADSDSHK